MTGAVSPRRPRVPSDATFTPGRRLRAGDVRRGARHACGWSAPRALGGARYRASAADAPVVGGAPLWPDDSLDARRRRLPRGGRSSRRPSTGRVSGLVSRGFRAPHMTDLGTLGLTGSGFEVAAADLRAANLARHGRHHGRCHRGVDRRSGGGGRPGVEPERRGHGRPIAAAASARDLTVFVNHMHDNIQKVALILPRRRGGHHARRHADHVAERQRRGVRRGHAPRRCWCATTSTTRASGASNTRCSASLGHGLLARTAFTYIRAEDTATDLPPNIEGGTPQPAFCGMLRWTLGRRAASTSSRTCRRRGSRRTCRRSISAIGAPAAGRTRTSIRNFFNNGARNRGWVGAGADGVGGTADDVLTVTGETVAQITTRVLGAGAPRRRCSRRFPATRRSARAVGVRVGRHEVVVDLENLERRELPRPQLGHGRARARRVGALRREVLTPYGTTTGSSLLGALSPHPLAATTVT